MIRTRYFLNPKIESQDHTKGSMKKKKKKELKSKSKSKVPFEIRKLIWTSVGWLLLHQQNKNSRN